MRTGCQGQSDSQRNGTWLLKKWVIVHVKRQLSLDSPQGRMEAKRRKREAKGGWRHPTCLMSHEAQGIGINCQTDVVTDFHRSCVLDENKSLIQNGKGRNENSNNEKHFEKFY
jgi:hypothetical protein